MKLAVTYSRVSTAAQLREGYSVDAQQVAEVEYARGHSIEIVARFDASETGGKHKRRAEFERMVAFLRVRRDVRVVLVEKVDRLYRNFRDHEMLDDLGVEIHFIKTGIVIRPGARSSDVFMHDIELARARHYLLNLSEEVKKGMKRKCEEGGYPSWAPVGYINVTHAVEKKRTGGIAIDPVKGPLVRQLFEAAATGRYSLRDLVQLAEHLGLRGGRHASRSNSRIGKSQLVKILNCRVYTGSFDWSGVRYRGIYEPLISVELFDKVLDVLARGSRPKGQTHRFTYSGAIWCAAHGVMTGDLKKGRYVYYFCRPCRVWIPEAALHAAFGDVLQSLALDEAVSAFVIGELTRWYDAAAQREAERAAAIRKRLTELEHFSEAAYEEKLNGLIDEATWRARDARWRAEAQRLRADAATITPTVVRDEFIRRASAPFELLQRASAQYLAQDGEQRARLFRACCSNFNVNDANVSVNLRSPFDVIAKIAKTAGGWGKCTDFEPLLLEYIEVAILGRAA